MNISRKNSTLLFRVFFLILCIGIIGFLWEQNNSFTSTLKAEGGHISEGVVGAPRFINPVLAQTQADLDLTRLLFTPLLSIDRNGDTFYNLIEEIESSADGLSYIVHLKKNIVFQDGASMTADDVVFTIESIQDSQIKSPLASKWQGVVVEKIDTYSVKFKLARAFNDFLYNLEIGVLPKHIWGSIKPQEFIFSHFNTDPIGSGPYKVKKISKEQNGIPSKYTLQRSTDHQEQPFIREIDLHFFDNEESLIDSLHKGDIDAAYGISPMFADDFDSSFRIHSATLPRVFALFFNQEKQALFKSQKIREAINLGINKSALVKDVFEGYASPTNSTFGFESKDIFSADAAEKLITSDGWVKNDTGIYTKKINQQEVPLEFSIAIPNITDMQAVAEAIRTDLAHIGIRVIVRSYDQGNLSQNIIRPREYESLLFGYEIEKPSDLYAFWHSSQISDPGLNLSLFKNPTVDTALLSLRSSKEQDLIGLDSTITKATPAVFIYSPSYIYILPKDIKDAVFSINKSSDRFNTIENWYRHTRRIWNIFISRTEE